MQPVHRPLVLHDFQPEFSFCEAVLNGLQRAQKELPCKFFYDMTGSALFDLICQLDQYYLTRTELEIMSAHVGRIAQLIGPDCLLVEYGSGSSLKTRLLLEQLQSPAGYVPIDISRDHLVQTVAAMADDYPDLEILPVCADYMREFRLPTPSHPPARRLVYFPGSTISNLHPSEALALLRSIASLCQPNGGLLIGVDLKKDPNILHQAYNDNQGVTAAFNLNILSRINRELGADFDLQQFHHYALYNPRPGRVEMHLISKIDQVVKVSGMPISFKAAEPIWTESSYKYTLQQFAELASRANLRVQRVWTDAKNLFSLQYLTVSGSTLPAVPCS